MSMYTKMSWGDFVRGGGGGGGGGILSVSLYNL